MREKPLAKGASGGGVRRPTYRHGHVREAAIAATLDLAAAGDARALSLRQVASRIGVAHRSLYNHFADRAALMDAVAQTGFEELASHLRAAATRAEFVAAYVCFVLKNPALYEIMRSQPLTVINQKPDLQRAIHLSVAESARLFCEPGQSAGERRRAVLKVLMLLYGGISLYREGAFDFADADQLIAELQAMLA